MDTVILLHPPVLHLLPFPVVLLALARRRCGKGYADHGSTVQAAADRLVECVHVPGQETFSVIKRYFCSMKKILVISSSLRHDSNSDALAEAFAKGAAEAGNEVESITLKGKNLHFCTGCLACQKTQKCVIADDISTNYASFSGILRHISSHC